MVFSAGVNTNEQKNDQRHSFKSVVVYLGNETRKCYSSKYVLKWSFWVIISTCCNYQVGNYIQPLWEEIRPSTDSLSESTETYNNSSILPFTRISNSEYLITPIINKCNLMFMV